MGTIVPDPFVGRVIDGKYRIEERIGTGGMGTVYRALHVGLGAMRAIKVMRRELAEDPALVERFRNEARLVEGLRHPHLVSLHDFAQLADGTLYIVSEFVEGESLAALLRRGVRFPAGDVALILGQVAEGLALAHRKGVVHRDISPDNIMVTRGEAGEPKVKLLDFGIAKEVGGPSSQTGSSVLMGKLGYASPEQMGLLAHGEKIDARSDVFSLSAVAYELLSGRLPWRKDSVQSYVHDLIVRPELEIQAEIRSRVPLAWQGALERGLARERERRTPDMPTLKAEMEEAARREASLASVLPRTQTIPGAITPVKAPRRTAVPGRPAGARARAIWIGLSAAAMAVLALTLWTRLFPEAIGTTAAPGSPPPSVVAGAASSLPAEPASEGPPATLAPPPAPASLDLSPAARREIAKPSGRTLPLEAVREPRPVRVERAADGSPGESAGSPSPTPEPLATSPPRPSPPEPPLPATLVLRSTPEAVVHLDGQPRGRTPTILTGVASGRHRLSLTTDDGRHLEETIDVGPGATVEKDHRFPGYGILSVTSEVWVEVSVDNGPAQQTPYSFKLLAGRHTVRASRAGFREQVREVEIKEGQTMNLHFAPERLR